MKHCYYALVLLLLAASCQPRLYFPDRANAPALSKPLEGKLTLSLKPQTNERDNDIEGRDFSFGADAAFAPIDHLGIMASYRRLNHKYLSESKDFFTWSYGGDYTGSRYEGAIGYFDRLGGKGRWDIYLGYGNGHLERTGWRYPERDYALHYHRFFLQPSIGMGNDVFLVNGGFRLAWHSYYDFTSPDPDLRYNLLEDNSDIQSEISGFIEPFINMEVGYKFARFNFQTGWSTQLMGSKVGTTLPFYVSMGLTFHLLPEYFTDNNKR